ncbi:triphosphoribosyl-dephospho-CoA synthase MdcB [Rugamonas aquatica]|uniref:triphosphoribosyl-dephospho-CoA synthase n=1 Tax=Rugamonas aquatica TaxID=2743357 RepID=A0A6A7N6V1_9BURK|nr:triphosphoribosyl-dephospho-CoA synthase MdcB [Rugamonas aquatica]MQA40834.1 triphosphoribosyl-dephospho-CoA synthase MdcB [Rugamonas aquatica]
MMRTTSRLIATPARAAMRMRAGVPAALGRAAQRDFACEVARLAVRSLYAELCLYPKPGLVSLVDTGSHDDMNALTFMRSLFSLRHYFKKICLAGWHDAPFARLKQLGIEAEASMLEATCGINTHRGAIFSLGLLCATAGRARAQGTPMTPVALRAAMLIRWGEELAMHAAPTDARADAPAAGLSNGLRVAARYAVSGAREEGALGLPSVFEIGVPALLAARARGASMTHARIDTLFTLMARINDSNVYHRAGPQGAQTVRAHAQRFIDLGGTANADWCTEALDSHQAFVQQRLSPGGAADLLAASCLVQAITAMDCGQR